MENKGYVLDKNSIKTKQRIRQYDLEELQFMTTCQLREICRKEKLIQGILNPLDKEEIIRIIMHELGNKKQDLIKDWQTEGWDRLQKLFKNVRIEPRADKDLEIASKISCYEGLELSYYDEITISYYKELEGTNAFLLNSEKEICGIFYFSAKESDKNRLYLMKYENLPCAESVRNDYSLYCFGQLESDLLYRIYYNEEENFPEHLKAYKLSIMEFEVKKPSELLMPMAIDFGSTNTTAGIYLDSAFLEGKDNENYLKGMGQETIQYTTFYEKTPKGIIERNMLPSVVGIVAAEQGNPQFVFGYDAVRLTNVSYVDEGFCVFYDIKRWIGDYDKKEEITDREGRKAYIKRKDILRGFFQYVINQTANRFKCSINKVHISCPVKQKLLFRKLFKDILPEYYMEIDESVDEGAAVLYNTISSLIENHNYKENYSYEALMIDCGGGTTDLCASRFSISDKRIAYEVKIETAYENGDTDFGGNNLTFRIMQLLKIMLTIKCGQGKSEKIQEIIQSLDMDIFRFIDKYSTTELYRKLDTEYEETEKIIPTRFKDYIANSKNEYYKVKNNFYYLFFLAEEIKKRFYDKIGTLKVKVSTEEPEEKDVEWIRADKWKISLWEEGEIITLKEFPALEFDLYTVELVLKGDIYGIIRKFMEPLYRDGRINRFSFIRLTGQSCKINIFRSALKEFIPGKRIQFKKRNRESGDDAGLKMMCVDGALKYMRDKKFGYADVMIHSQEPILPYTISAYTHNGQEVELVNGFIKEDATKSISRNLENVTLQLFLKDTDGTVRYSFHYDCRQERFRVKTCEQIAEIYGNHIQQKDMDSIVDNEIKFFLWKNCEEWGYIIVPVYRKDEDLYLGQDKFYSFENEGWVKNFFDGTR